MLPNTMDTRRDGMNLVEFICDSKVLNCFYTKPLVMATEPYSNHDEGHEMLPKASKTSW